MRSIPLAMTWEMLCHWRWHLLGALLGANLFPTLILAALRHEGPIDPDDYAYLVMHMVMTQMNMFICVITMCMTRYA